MQNASTVIRPRTARSRSIVPSLPGEAPAPNCRTRSGRHRVCATKTAQRAELSALGEALCLLPQRQSYTEVIERAGYAMPALLQDVGVDHGRGKILVPKQLLNGADVGAALKQVRGKGVSTMPGIGIVDTMPIPGLCRRELSTPCYAGE